MNDKHFSPESIAKRRSEKRISYIDPKSIVTKCIEDANTHSGTFLDIGTGTGLFAEHFQNLGFKITGIDDNEIMIKEAKRLVPSSPFIQATAEKIPFKDHEFDLSLMAHLLHEVENPVEVLKEAKRVTKSHLFILEWAYREEEMGPPLKHRLSEELMIDLLKKAGLSQCHCLQIKNTMLYHSKL